MLKNPLMLFVGEALVGEAICVLNVEMKSQENMEEKNQRL